MFRQAWEASCVADVHLIKVDVEKKHFDKLTKNGSPARTQYVLDCVVKAMLEDQGLLETLGNVPNMKCDATMIKCRFHDLLIHHCGELTAELSQHGQFGDASSLDYFNHHLMQFHHCFEALVHPLSLCASDEFHHGDSQGKALGTSEPVKFIESLTSLQLLPDVT